MFSNLRTGLLAIAGTLPACATNQTAVKPVETPPPASSSAPAPEPDLTAMLKRLNAAMAEFNAGAATELDAMGRTLPTPTRADSKPK